MSSRFSMEEMRARKMVNNASGSGKEVIITIDKPKSYLAGNEWMEEKLRSLDKIEEEIDKNKTKQDQKPRIQRIPMLLRGQGNMEKYYVPRAFAIGPLHHRDPRLEQTEVLKLKLTAHFIKKHNISKQDLYQKIESEINHLRSRYVEEDIKSYSNQELTWIFLVDGCSTLSHIDSYIEGAPCGWEFKQDQVQLFGEDIFLLENQLPFELLQMIMDSCPNGMNEWLMESIYMYIYYRSLTTAHWLESTAPQHASTAYEEDKKSKSTRPTHLLDLLRNVLTRGSYLTKSDQEMETRPESFELDEWHKPLSASEMKKVGIIIKGSKTSSIKDIRFTRKMFTGILYLPTLLLEYTKVSQFMNLVAYEMCPDFYSDLEVISYLSFMNALIQLPDDVKVLGDARVLVNYFGSEGNVAELFKSFRNSGVTLNAALYNKVAFEIQRYYNRMARIATWITQGINDYFSTPWKAMATIAAVLLLAMTFIQAFYAVKDKK